MRNWFNKPCLLLFLVLLFHFSRAQTVDPVIWRFDAGPANGDRTTLYMHALLAPGWHLYSQFLSDGGPVPTRFYFDDSEGLVLVGRTREKGDAVTFYDSTYEMEITWYPEEVFFEQDVRPRRGAGSVKGHVDFMVCNETMCIPASKDFVIEVGE